MTTMKKKLKHENVIFETMREANEWADSISNEIHGATINGYVTPDSKIAYALVFILCQNPHYVVRSREDIEHDPTLYKVWIEQRDDLLF